MRFVLRLNNNREHKLHIYCFLLGGGRGSTVEEVDDEGGGGSDLAEAAVFEELGAGPCLMNIKAER